MADTHWDTCFVRTNCTSSALGCGCGYPHAHALEAEGELEALFSFARIAVHVNQMLISLSRWVIESRNS